MAMFDNIKVGDKVLYCINNKMAIKTVEHVTKTKIVVNGLHFKRNDGYISNSQAANFTISRIKPYDEKIAEQLKTDRARKLLIYDIRNLEIETLPLPALQKIYDFLKQTIEENNK